MTLEMHDWRIRTVRGRLEPRTRGPFRVCLQALPRFGSTPPVHAERRGSPDSTRHVAFAGSKNRSRGTGRRKTRCGRPAARAASPSSLAPAPQSYAWPRFRSKSLRCTVGRRYDAPMRSVRMTRVGAKARDHAAKSSRCIRLRRNTWGWRGRVKIGALLSDF